MEKKKVKKIDQLIQKRKIIQIDRTYYVSLSPKWIRQYKLSKADILEVVMQGDSLVIKPYSEVIFQGDDSFIPKGSKCRVIKKGIEEMQLKWEGITFWAKEIDLDYLHQKQE